METKRKRAIVVIDIDMDGKPEPSASAPKDLGTGEDGIPMTAFKVTIRPNTLAEVPDSDSSLRTSLAHEFGHIVAHLADTQANRNDPRTRPANHVPVADPGQAIRDSEQEAWDIARQIDPQLDEKEAQANLASYSGKDANDHAQFIQTIGGFLALLGQQNVCPTCKRRIPVARPAGQDKRLTDDLGKANRAIASLERFAGSTWEDTAMLSGRELWTAEQRTADHESSLAAAQEELTRLRSALTDYGLLWRIYRRAEKRDTAYRLPIAAVEQVAA